MDISYKTDSISPHVHALIQAAVLVTPMLRGRYGRRMALHDDKKPEADLDKDK